jgi:hypothetical protein
MSKSSNTKWQLSAQGDDGEEFELATEWHPSSLPRTLVYNQMMEAHWDPRLDSASCVPILTKLE